MIFSTDNGGWDWSLAFRYGSLTTWEGSTRVESLLQAYSGKWYHVVAVFDPVQGRTILYSNGQSTTLDSIGVDGNSDLIRVGRGYWGRTFDGLIDDAPSLGALSRLEKSPNFGAMVWVTLARRPGLSSKTRLLDKPSKPRSSSTNRFLISMHPKIFS